MYSFPADGRQTVEKIATQSPGPLVAGAAGYKEKMPEGILRLEEEEK
jgi:hypothetical protein